MRILSTVFLMLIASTLYGQFDPYAETLLSHQCDPSSCEEYYGWAYSGEVSTDIYGTCKVIPAVEAHGGVVATGCVIPVFLDSEAFVNRHTLYDEDTGIYYLDEVEGIAEAFSAYNVFDPYWTMINVEGCDGFEPVWYLAPPASC